MSEGQETASFLSLFPQQVELLFEYVFVCRTSGQLCAWGRGPGCRWGSGGTQFVMSEQVVQLGWA